MRQEDWMSHTLTLAAFAALALLGAPAHAAVTTPARDSVATIDFADSGFNRARLRIDATQTIGAGSSGSKAVGFNVAPSIRGYTLSSTSAVGVALDAFTPPARFDLTVSAAGAGSWGIAEHFAGSDDIFGPGPLYRFVGGNDTFVPFTHNRLRALELTLFVGGLVDDGGRFGVGLSLPGDWSTTAGFDSTTGQHFVAGLDPAWVIDSDFTYDAAAKRTVFHATNPAYGGVDSDHQSPFLDVYLFGTIPEPAMWAMMVAGFGLVGAMARRRGASVLA